jgi:hypothetical protein
VVGEFYIVELVKVKSIYASGSCYEPWMSAECATNEVMRGPGSCFMQGSGRSILHVKPRDI